MNRLVIALGFFILINPGQFLFSENIRGNVIKNVYISDTQTAEENTFDMKIEEIFSISFDDNINSLKGVEIEIKIPPVLKSYNSSIAFEIFKQVTPEVKTGIGTYYGVKYNSIFIPEASCFYLQIPFEDNINQENVPYTTTIKEVLSLNDSPLMITANPVMKGFPSFLYDKYFSVSVYPLLKSSGSLDLNIKLDKNLDASNLVVSIDGEIIKLKNTKETITLAAGRHIINTEISGGLSSTKTFSIFPGDTTALEIILNSLESFLKIDVPENTEIYLDGELKELEKGNTIKAEPGEHTILFMIGDYKISKKFTLSPGKDCNISLFLDILVNEN